MNHNVRDRTGGSQPTPINGAVTESSSTSSSKGGAAQVQKTARGTAINLVGSITATVVTFVTVGVITRTYGRDGAGVFFAVTALFTLAANSARLGAETSLTFFVSRFRASGQHAKIRALVMRALTGTALVAIAAAAVGFITAPMLAQRLISDESYVAEATLMIRILAAAVPTFALTQAMFGATRGFDTMRPSVIAGQIVRPVVQLVLVAALVLLGSDQLWPLAAIWAISSLAAVLSVGQWLNKRLAAVSRRPASEVHDHEPPLPAYIQFTGPRAASDLLSAGLERLDVLLVAAILGQAAAGLYGTANRLILAGQLMMIATAQSMAPHLSASFSKGNNDDSQHMLRTITGWNVLILWPLFLGLVFGAKPALSLFGDDFIEAAPLVQVLAGAFLVITGLGTGDTVLMMTGGAKASLANHAISLVVMVAASLVLLPAVGVIGAAVAWAISRVLLRVLAGVQVYRTTGVHAIGRPVLIAAAAATICFGSTGLGSLVLFDPGFVAVGFHAAVGGLFYLVAIRFLQDELSISDLAAVIKRR